MLNTKCFIRSTNTSIIIKAQSCQKLAKVERKKRLASWSVNRNRTQIQTTTITRARQHLPLVPNGRYHQGFSFFFLVYYLFCDYTWLCSGLTGSELRDHFWGPISGEGDQIQVTCCAFYTELSLWSQHHQF